MPQRSRRHCTPRWSLAKRTYVRPVQFIQRLSYTFNMKRGRPPYPDILTPRELEVLHLVRQKLTNQQIAGRLGITERGVRFHVSEILSKLGVRSREEAASWRPSSREWGFVFAAARATVTLVRSIRVEGVRPARFLPAAGLISATALIAVVLLVSGGDNQSADTHFVALTDFSADETPTPDIQPTQAPLIDPGPPPPLRHTTSWRLPRSDFCRAATSRIR